jgi:hypothetical protein
MQTTNEGRAKSGRDFDGNLCPEVNYTENVVQRRFVVGRFLACPLPDAMRVGHKVGGEICESRVTIGYVQRQLLSF